MVWRCGGVSSGLTTAAEPHPFLQLRVVTDAPSKSNLGRGSSGGGGEGREEEEQYEEEKKKEMKK